MKKALYKDIRDLIIIIFFFYFDLTSFLITPYFLLFTCCRGSEQLSGYFRVSEKTYLTVVYVLGCLFIIYNYYMFWLLFLKIPVIFRIIIGETLKLFI